MKSFLGHHAMRFLVAGAVIAAGAAVPSVASAASETVKVDAQNVVQVEALPGVSNNVTVDARTAESVTVTGASPAAGAGCEQRGPTTVVCARAQDGDPDNVEVRLADGNDRATLYWQYIPSRSVDTMYVWGGSGNDLLRGSPDADWFYGEDGNDRLVGGDARDHLFGGPGSDRLSGGPGVGDEFDAGEGNDIIYARDGQRDDYPVCGAGIDTLFADPLGVDPTLLRSSCETVSRA
jgi:Ca2+-binding RTX toxin-like protein